MELYRGIVSGNEEALKQLHQQYFRQLVYFGYRITQHLTQSEDSVTDAFLKLWNARSSLKNAAHIKSYLFQCVKHSSIDFIKTNRNRIKSHEQLRYLSDEKEEHTDLLLTESEVIREIAAQIASLPPQCGKVFSYIFFEGMSTDQVAAKMKISSRNVLNQKAIAIKMVRSALLKKGLLPALVYFLKNY